MMRIHKTIGTIAAAFLLLSTLLGSFGAATAEAASSRVAVIKELKGSVKVKKAGGSKTFAAFARMSLNEGDILSTDGKGSAVLLFSNGSSEDDRMTVSANTTITFSKLTSRGGTTTKVSMFNGSAWVDVKSIQNENDEFTLETPTAIMGVRGTHLLVSVDPATNMTHLTVAAGVVHTETNGSNNPQEQDVYPTQRALITDSDEEADGEIIIAPVDLALLMDQSDSSIVTAILESAADITEENARYVAQYTERGLPSPLGDTQDDLNRFKTNTENLLGAVANQALKSGLLTQERLEQIIREVQTQSGMKVDLSKSELALTDEQKKQQEDQRRKEEEKRKKAEEQRTPEGEQEKKLKEIKSKQNQDNSKAEAEKKRKQLEEYEKQLSEAEQRRFADDKVKREKERAEAQAAASASPTTSSSQTPDPTPSPTDPTLSDVSSLDALKAFGTGIYGFNPATTSYTLQVSNLTATLPVSAIVAANSNAMMRLSDAAIASGEQVNVTLNAAGTDTVIPIVVTAENGVDTTTYTITVHREANLAEAADVSLPGGVSFDPQVTVYTLESVTSDVYSISMRFGYSNSPFKVKLTSNGTLNTADAGTSFDVPLVQGDNVILISLVPIVTSENQTVTMTQQYTFNIKRTEVSEPPESPSPSPAPFLDDLKVFGASLAQFAPAKLEYTIRVSNITDSIPMKAIASGSIAMLKLNGHSVASGEEVNAVLNSTGTDTVFSFEVTAAGNDSNTTTYTLTVQRDANLAEQDDVTLPGGVVFDPQVTTYTLNSVASSVDRIVMQFGKGNGPFTVNVKSNGTFIKTVNAGSSFDVPLAQGDNEIIIALVPNVTPNNQAVTMTQQYTFLIERADPEEPEQPAQPGFKFTKLTNANPSWITTLSSTNGLNRMDPYHWLGSLSGAAVNKVASLWFEAAANVSSITFILNTVEVSPAGDKYNVTLNAGWNQGSVNVTFIDDSEPENYFVTIWVGDTPPSALEIVSFAAVDQDANPVQTGADAINSMQWYAQTTGTGYIDITPAFYGQLSKAEKVVLSSGQEAEKVNAFGTFRIPYNGQVETALLYTKDIVGHLFAYQLNVDTASIDVELASLTAIPRTFGGDQTAIVFDNTLKSQQTFDVSLSRESLYGLVPYTIKVKSQRKLEQQVVVINGQVLGDNQDAFVNVDIGSKTTARATIQVVSESGRAGEYVVNFTRPLSGWTGLHSFRVYKNEGECYEAWKVECSLINTSSFQATETNVLTILPSSMVNFRIEAPTTDWRTTVVISIDGVPISGDAVQLDSSKDSFLVKVHITSEDGLSTADYSFELRRIVQGSA